MTVQDEQSLTDVESGILRMIVGQMSAEEIAFALGISAEETTDHFQNIFAKVGVLDRVSAAQAAIERGLIKINL